MQRRRVLRPGRTQPAGGKKTGAVTAVFGTTARRVAVGVTGTLGVVGGVAAVWQQAASFFAVTATVQMTMSISLPFLGAGLGHAAGRVAEGWPKRQIAVVGSACAAAVMLALFGCLVAAVCSWVGAVSWGPRWFVAVGTAVAIQLLAQLVGTGLGLLVARVWVAGVLTVLLPLAAYAALSGTAAQAWLTPYGALQNVFVTTADGADWGRWVVVFAVWGVALNVVGCLRARPRADNANRR